MKKKKEGGRRENEHRGGIYFGPELSGDRSNDIKGQTYGSESSVSVNETEPSRSFSRFFHNVKDRFVQNDDESTDATAIKLAASFQRDPRPAHQASPNRTILLAAFPMVIYFIRAANVPSLVPPEDRSSSESSFRVPSRKLNQR